MTEFIGVSKLTVAEIQKCAQAAEGAADGQSAFILSMAAYYRHRFGNAPGCVARNSSNGETAVRFYDTVVKQYRWAVYPSPHVALDRTYYDELPAGFVVTENVHWAVLIAPAGWKAP